MTEQATLRLTRAERRDQLLDAACELLAERGLVAISMEGVAAAAGVSKALPYQHFDNADALLTAVRDREFALLGRRVLEAMSAAEAIEPKVTAAVHAWFETVKERGVVIASLLHWFPELEARARGRSPAATPFDWVMADVFEKDLGLPRAAARVAQRFFAIGLIGAYDAWLEGHATQAEAERTAVRLMIAGATGLKET